MTKLNFMGGYRWRLIAGVRKTSRILGDAKTPHNAPHSLGRVGLAHLGAERGLFSLRWTGSARFGLCKMEQTRDRRTMRHQTMVSSLRRDRLHDQMIRQIALGIMRGHIGQGELS